MDYEAAVNANCGVTVESSSSSAFYCYIGALKSCLGQCYGGIFDLRLYGHAGAQDSPGDPHSQRSAGLHARAQRGAPAAQASAARTPATTGQPRACSSPGRLRLIPVLTVAAFKLMSLPMLTIEARDLRSDHYAGNQRHRVRSSTSISAPRWGSPARE